MAELPERLSAQVITTLEDLSRIETLPSRAALGVITATKGPMDELHLVQTTNQLVSLFGEPSADHKGLVGAYKIISSGIGMYLVRVGNNKGEHKYKASTATIPGTAEVTAIVNSASLAQDSSSAADKVSFDYTKAVEDSAIGSYSMTPDGANWICKFNEDTPVTTTTSGENTTIGDTGIVVKNTGYTESFNFNVAATSSTTTVEANVVLEMSTPGTWGDVYSVTTATTNQTIRLSLFKGSLKVETFDVSLDPEADNFILDIASENFKATLPDGQPTPTVLIDGTYNFAGGDDGLYNEDDGLTEAYVGEIDESTGIASGCKLFLQPKVVAQIYPALGFPAKEYLNAMKAVSEQKKYITCIFDTPDELTLNGVCNWVNNAPDSAYENDPILSGWMCEVYWPWINDTYNGYPLQMPPSVYVTINSMNWWQRIGVQAPVAGNPRGILANVTAETEIPSVVDRDKLVTNRINPIFNTGVAGTQIYGNETLNDDYTDLRSAHISRQLAQIITEVNRATALFEFELNDSLTWQRWIDSTTRILQGYSEKGGLKWYGVRMGLDTTTAAEIAQRQIRGLIGLQFTQDAEVFWLNYAVYASSAEDIDF